MRQAPVLFLKIDDPDVTVSSWEAFDHMIPPQPEKLSSWVIFGWLVDELHGNGERGAHARLRRG